MALEDGIVWHFKWENNASDSAGNLADGTFSGGGYSADDPVGTYSRELDNIDDRITWTNEAEMNPGTGDFTFIFLAKFVDVNDAAIFYGKGFGLGTRLALYWSFTELWLIMGPTVYKFTPPAISNDTYYMFGVSVDRDSNVSFHMVDSSFGTFDPSGQSGLDITNLNDMVIGARSDLGAHWFGGKIAQATFWNRAISQAEGTEYYNSGSFLDLLAAGAPGGMLASPLQRNQIRHMLRR